MNSDLLTRLLPLEKAEILDDVQRVVRLSFSSETPVERSFPDRYVEVLGHGQDEVDLTRINTKSPLMLNHYESIGVVEKAWLDGSRGVAEVRLSKRGSLDDLWGDIKGGIITNVSVGYKAHKQKRSMENGIPLVRITKWEPYEISILDMPPADFTVGIGRSLEEKNMSEESKEQTVEVRADSEAVAAQKLEEAQRRGAELEAQRRGAELEAQRRNIISALFRNEWKNEFKELYERCVGDCNCTPDKARKELLDALGKVSETGNSTGGEAIRTQAGIDSSEKLRQAISDALIYRAGVVDAKGKRPDIQGNEFRGMSLIDVARNSLERAGVLVKGLTNMELVGRAFTQSTSDFPVLMEGVIHRTLLGAYQSAPDTWRRWCSVGSVSDFREWSRLFHGTLGNLDSVNELGEFANKSIPDLLQEKISITTRGNLINLSRQAIINDDLGYFARLSQELGRAAARTVESQVYTTFLSNPVMHEDSTALFHANHGNLDATGAVISVTSIEAARVAMAKQMEPSKNDYLDIRPSVLLCPISLGGVARVVNEAQYDPDTANKLQRPNMVRGLFRDIIDTPRLSGNAWYMLADPNDAPTVEVAFLNGQQTPYMEMQPGFDVDGVRWKVRLDFGVAVIGWRGAYKNVGA